MTMGRMQKVWECYKYIFKEFLIQAIDIYKESE